MAWMTLRLVVVLGLLCASSAAAGFGPVELPGQPKGGEEELFGGYASFEERGSTTHSFHLLARSRGRWKSQPLVLWLTGGPGCSSLFGAFTENGPFRVDGDVESKQKLKYNPDNWAQSASMLYLESPPGVGFSYRDDGNYTYGDTTTAESNFLFIQKFFESHPEYQDHDFFVSGESYGGHYVPQLVAKIVESNSRGDTSIPLRGFLVGNPTTDGKTDSSSYVPFAASHTLASSEEAEAIFSACNNSYHNTGTPGCSAAFERIQATIGAINPYNIYAKCVGEPGHGGCFTSTFSADKRSVYGSSQSFEAVQSENAEPFRSQTFIPCMNDIVTPPTVYFNRADVQKALGVKGAAGRAGQDWEACSPYLTYNQYAPTMLPLYESFLEVTSMRMLVYSGDVDMCVPWIATQASLDKMQLELTSKWRFWSVQDTNSTAVHQVAGYTKTFEGRLTYATVKDAGHMVPYFQPRAAFYMFSRFINDEEL